MTHTLATSMLRIIALLAMAVPATVNAATVFYATDKLGTEKGNELPVRHIVDKGGTISVWVDGCDVIKVEFVEEKRNTRFYDEISKIVQKLVQKAKCDPRPVEWKYVTTEVRANITVKASDATGTELATKTIITGPKEHLFVSLDLPVTNRKTVKYDDEKKSIVPADENPQLYFGLNFQLGDVLLEPARMTMQDRLQVKAMVLASRHPKDSYGVGVGYNIDGTRLLGFEFKGIGLFAGYFETKVDATVDGVVKPKGGKDKKWQFGVSYDIGTALGWVKLK